MIRLWRHLIGSDFLLPFYRGSESPYKATEDTIPTCKAMLIFSLAIAPLLVVASFAEARHYRGAETQAHRLALTSYSSIHNTFKLVQRTNVPGTKNSPKPFFPILHPSEPACLPPEPFCGYKSPRGETTPQQTYFTDIRFRLSMCQP
jgi:hypothetical protein